MADPTTAQRKVLAKMGLAMPDGSYYIRNGVVGANDLDNAIKAVGRGVAAGDDGDAIRCHIMKRAAALKLSARIPDTWNADGSLKHMTLEEALEHFGVKGMHWGQRKGGAAPETTGRKAEKVQKLTESANKREALAVAHGNAALKYEKESQDVLNNGVRSAAFKRVYGNFAADQTDREFYARNRQTKAQALQEVSNNLRMIHNYHARAANHHAKVAVKLRNKVADLQHSDFDVDALITGLDEETIRHFGVKGMHWGQRRPKGPSSEDHARTTELHAKIKSHGGIHALTNSELEEVTKRMNLEGQYSRLTSGDISAGKKAADQILDIGGSVAKQQATSYANKFAAKGVEHLIAKATAKK